MIKIFSALRTMGRGKRQLFLACSLPIVSRALFFLSLQSPYDTKRPLRRKDCIISCRSE